MKNAQTKPRKRSLSNLIALQKLESRILLDSVITVEWTDADWIDNDNFSNRLNWIDKATGEPPLHAPINTANERYNIIVGHTGTAKAFYGESIWVDQDVTVQSAVIQTTVHYDDIGLNFEEKSDDEVGAYRFPGQQAGRRQRLAA